MNFLVAYPATLAAKGERLIVFRCVIEKKELPKKNVITKDGVSRIPTIPTICGGPPSRLSREVPQFPSSLINLLD